MDAREYLNRKGVGVEREPDRPNTLEEKSWERARGAGQQRPKSGTPHDWEDWERYHDDLAQGATELEQKIDKQAHRKEARERASLKPGQPVVEHFTPPVSSPESTSPPAPAKSSDARLEAKAEGAQSKKGQPEKTNFEKTEPDATSPANEPKALKVAYMVLAVLLPPLALGLAGAGAARILTGVVLTLLGWLPGVIYALWWIKRL